MLEIDPCGGEWAMLSHLLDQALEVSEEHRARWIDSLPFEHDAIRPRLRRLLCAQGSVEARAFLQTIPKVDVRDRTNGDSAEDPPPLPETIAPYRVLKRLAEGGMGTVWLAHRTDVMVNRLVALKLPKGARRGARFAERMAEEREILAALNHPNIARLYDAGDYEQRPAVPRARVRRGTRRLTNTSRPGSCRFARGCGCSCWWRAPSRTRTPG